jgi:hypothetical protein
MRKLANDTFHFVLFLQVIGVISFFLIFLMQSRMLHKYR